MSTRVYAYGCGEPTKGLDDAMAEHDRCIAMWDRLALLERETAAKEREVAAADDPDYAAVQKRIGEMSRALAEHPDDKSLRAERRKAFSEARIKLNAWRKTHRDMTRALDKARQKMVVAIRQSVTCDALKQDQLYWGNSNRVLQSYETGRKVARLKVRLIRPFDPERDDGVLMVQIQKTRTGLGAAPSELTDRSYGHLQFSVPDDRGQAKLSFRVDAADHHIELPIWIHRPLPPEGRVKVAQLTWRRRGDRLRWQLCLTVTGITDMPMRHADKGMPVEFDWKDQGELEVMRIGGKVWRLPQTWMVRMDKLERAQGLLDEALHAARKAWGDHEIAGPLLALPHWQDRIHQMAIARPHLPQEIVLWWVQARRLWLSIPGQRAHILGHRREIYRQWAREVACHYAAIQLPELDIATYAREEQGEPENATRHRAAVHTLRQELIHQCTKAGSPVFSASAEMVNAPKDGEATAWARRKAAKRERSQPPMQPHDSQGV